MTQPTDDHIAYYLEEMDYIGAVVPVTPGVSDLDDRAMRAFCRMVDLEATVEDLQTYRAWITHLRLRGWTERQLEGSLAVADHEAKRLGVA